MTTQIAPTPTGQIDSHLHGVCDTTAPPTPTVIRSMAFERGTQHAAVDHPAPAGAGRFAYPKDPALIELGNVEMDSTVEIINKSANPKATFDKDAIKLEITGVDPHQRRASIYLSQEVMDKLDLKAGDILDLRVKDAEGNASSSVRIELEPDDWAANRIRDLIDGAWRRERGVQLTNVLDGASAYKNFIAKAVNDGRAPMLTMDDVSFRSREWSKSEKALASCLLEHMPKIKEKSGGNHFTRAHLDAIAADEAMPEQLRSAAKALRSNDELFDDFETAWGHGGDASTGKDGAVGDVDLNAIASGSKLVVMEASDAIEPRSRVTVFNNRTGETFQGHIGDDQKLRLSFGTDLVQNGDALLIRPFDNEGNQGQELKVVFSSCAKGGKAKIQNPLDLRIKPAIP